MVKREMLVVSEQLHYLDQTAVWWLREGRAGKNHDNSDYGQKKGILRGELVLYAVIGC